MKLKRILSLALSGVLAVSMLTACGIGGGAGLSGNSIKEDTNAVRRAMNTELDDQNQGTLNYTTDRDLTNATAAVARTLTEAEAKAATKDGAIVSGTASNMMSRYVKYDTWTSGFGTYHPTTAAELTYVTALVFDGSMTAQEVGEAMASNVAKWDLEHANTTLNSFEGNVAAYKVTIKATGDEAKDISVWFVGLMLEQTPVQSSTAA